MKRTLIALALVAVAQGAYATTTAYPPEAHATTTAYPETSGINAGGGPTTSGINKAQRVKRAEGTDLRNAGNKMHKNTGITRGTSGTNRL